MCAFLAMFRALHTCAIFRHSIAFITLITPKSFGVAELAVLDLALSAYIVVLKTVAGLALFRQTGVGVAALVAEMAALFALAFLQCVTFLTHVALYLRTRHRALVTIIRACITTEFVIFSIESITGIALVAFIRFLACLALRICTRVTLSIQQTLPWFALLALQCDTLEVSFDFVVAAESIVL